MLAAIQRRLKVQLYRLLTAAALAFAAVAAHAATPEEVAQRSLNAYKQGKGAAMLAVENACWKAATKTTVLPCAHAMIAGGMIDQAMQQLERRGPLVAFSPALQRQRFFKETTRLGLSNDDAQAVLEEAMQFGMPLIYKGLAEGGLPMQ